MKWRPARPKMGIEAPEWMRPRPEAPISDSRVPWAPTTATQTMEPGGPSFLEWFGRGAEPSRLPPAAWRQGPVPPLEQAFPVSWPPPPPCPVQEAGGLPVAGVVGVPVGFVASLAAREALTPALGIDSAYAPVLVALAGGVAAVALSDAAFGFGNAIGSAVVFAMDKLGALKPVSRA